MSKIKIMSVFSGVGGLELGLDHERFEVVGHSEINKSSCLILNHRFPDIKNYGDITKIDSTKLPKFDMLVGGSPCFRKGTLIHTENGLKKIEEVELGEKLLTHNNRYMPVLEKMVNHTTSIHLLKAFGLESLYVTEGHPLYCVKKNKDGTFTKPEWVAVKDITKKHYLLRPINKNMTIEEYKNSLFVTEDLIALSVISNDVELTDELVYNFEVEDDHSYVANNIVAHNCQNLSMAGNKKGLAGAKSSLFFIFVKLLKENNPDYFIWENVKGTFFSNTGLDFLAVQKEFHEAGYHFQWQLLNAEDFGVAQVRNRVFVVGSKRKEDLPGLINVLKGTKVKNESVKFTHFCGQLINEGLVSTITASYGALSGNGTKIIESHKATKENLKNIIDNGTGHKFVRLLTHIESERLMSWEDDWTKFGRKEDGTQVLISDRERYRAIGNGIVSNCIKVLTENFLVKPIQMEEETSLNNLSSYSISNAEEYKKFLAVFKLIENEDYVLKGKTVYIKNFKFVQAIFNNETLRVSIIKLKHSMKGILTLDKHYMKDMNPHNKQSTIGTIKLNSILEKDDTNKKYLSDKECSYIYSKIK